jgi:Flp pilus assembly protein TadD
MKSRDLMPNDPRPHLQMAMIYDLSGRRGEARPLYDQVLKLQPDNPLALNNLAYLLAEEGGNLDQALTMAEKAKQKAPQNLDIADTLGWIYIKKNLSENAVRVLQEIVSKQPGNPIYRYHYGMALYQRGDKPSARRELEAALRNKPSKSDEVKIRELMAKIG